MYSPYTAMYKGFFGGFRGVGMRRHLSSVWESPSQITEENIRELVSRYGDAVEGGAVTLELWLRDHRFNNCRAIVRHSDRPEDLSRIEEVMAYDATARMRLGFG